MGHIGCLGDIAFEVSEETVRTLDNLKWSGAAKWAVHERHMYHALTEYTGMEPDKISFSVYLSAFLGVSPLEEVVKIWKYEREGTPLGLTIGDKCYGKYKWVITDHEWEPESYDGKGNVTTAAMKLNLLEYLRI